MKTCTQSITFFVIAMLVFSCTESNNSISTLDLSQSIEHVKLSSLVKEIEYIPLSSDSLLASITKVEFVNNKFYIKDNKSKLLKFNLDGVFENEIGKKGRGPGEYSSFLYFTVDAKTGFVYALINEKQKIYVYNSGGNYINEISYSKKSPDGIISCKDGLFIFYSNSHGDNPISFELIDLNGNVIKQFSNRFRFSLKKSFTHDIYMNECLFYNFQGNPYFKEIHSDTVFFLENTKIKPQFVLNTKNHAFTTEIRKNLNGDFSKLDNIVMQNNIMETDKYLFYHYFFKRRSRFLIFNKKTNEQFEINAEKGFINDFDGGPSFIFQSSINHNTLITWIDAYVLIEYINSEEFKTSTPKYPEKKKQLEQLANSLDENDNPVLMLVKLKE